MAFCGNLGVLWRLSTREALGALAVAAARVDAEAVVAELERFAKHGAGAWQLYEISVPLLTELAEHVDASASQPTRDRYARLEAALAVACDRLPSPRLRLAALRQLGLTEEDRDTSLTAREEQAARALNYSLRSYRRPLTRKLDGKYGSWREKVFHLIAMCVLDAAGVSTPVERPAERSRRRQDRGARAVTEPPQPFASEPARRSSTSVRDLFLPVSDEQWLDLADSRYRFGIEFVRPLSGSRSRGERTRAFQGFLLSHGGERRAQCVIKLGDSDAIHLEWQGWMDFSRRQPDRDSFARMDQPVVAGFGALVVTDFVGVGDAPCFALSDGYASDPELLPITLTRVLGSTLRPIHECLRPPAGPIPWRECSVLELLDERVSARTRAAVRQAVEDPGFATRPPDEPSAAAVSALLEGDADRLELPRSCVPVGAVHGDPNFNNIFLARDGLAKAALRVALIDFEWCREGPPESPFDDFARIECELLFGPLDPEQVIDLLPVVALGQWGLEGDRPLPAAAEPTRSVYHALLAVRRRVKELAHDCDPSRMTEFEHGYFSTLFARALAYVRYQHLGEDLRPAILRMCTLVADRLLQSPLQPPALPRFSLALRPISRGAGVARVVDGMLELDARAPAAYAAVVESPGVPIVEARVVVTLELTEAREDGWFGAALGTDPESPERTGVIVLCSWTTIEAARLSAQSQVSSANATQDASPIPMTALVGCQVTLELNLQGNTLRAILRVPALERTPAVVMHLPRRAYAGSPALVAHGARLVVTSFRTTIP